MGQRSGGLSRGDRRRNERLGRLRSLVRPELAIVAIDLAAERQAAVVADHDSRTVARRMFAGTAWVIEEILEWAEPIAHGAGFAGVVVACEPTGHRWKPVLDRSRARGIEVVCVQPLLVHRAREGEDFTRNRSDYADATVIARLAAQLHCYVPFAAEGAWARLRHLGARRAQLLVQATAARQQLRDLLECAWPAVLATCSDPAERLAWRACIDAGGADPARVRAMGRHRFEAATRRALGRWGGQRLNRRIFDAVWEAAAGPGGIDAERSAACERAGLATGDWRRALDEIADVEARMTAVLDELELTELVCSIPGLSAVGAAAILGECGDPARFDTPRALVKHAGICPRANESGTFRGTTKVSGRGRPLLRTATWRAIWGLLPHNPVYAARYQHLTTRSTNPLHDAQARAALGAALLRQLHVIVTRRVRWDPALAGTTQVTDRAA